MKEIQLSQVNFSRRVTAFLIDSVIVCFIRTFMLHIFTMYWLRKYIVDFVNSFKFVFDGLVRVGDLTDVHLRFFMQSELFLRLLMCTVALILVGFAYNLIMLSTKWSATIGQKIMGIFAVSKNEKTMRWYQIITRSFLAVFPLNTIFVLSMHQILGEIGVFESLTPLAFVLIIGIGLLVWYDMFFFTKDKLLMHDLLSGTKIVRRGKFSKGFFDKMLDFAGSITPNIGKTIGTAKKIIKKYAKNTSEKGKRRKKQK